MKVANRKDAWILLVGDILIFVFSLWLALILRSLEVPAEGVFIQHLLPFSILFVFWCLVFFITGLYEKHTLVFKSRLSFRVLSAQIFNGFVAVVFFYLAPNLAITPKTTLFIDILISLGLVYLWRIYGQELFAPKIKEKSIILGRGPEVRLLQQEINDNPRYGLEFVSSFDPDKLIEDGFRRNLLDQISSSRVSVVVMDMQDEILKRNIANFYKLLFSKIRFINVDRLYEDIFDRIPLSLIDYNWFLENVSLNTSVAYDVFKRATDLVFSLFLGMVSLIVYPFVYLAIKLDDGGPVFIVQDRLGENNRLIKIIKFRTMSFNDNEQGERKKENKITRVGHFLRKSRLDELPQLWNVFIGDLSLIGPRPELPALAQIYEEEIPYYNIRHLIKPGLSGWAQLYHENHPHRGANTEETKNKLSYDLYYVKNRSVLLDLKIILKTITALLSRTGR